MAARDGGPCGRAGQIKSFVDRFAQGGPLADLVPHLARCGQFAYTP